MSPFPFENLINNGVPNYYVKNAINEADVVVAVSPSLSKRIESFGFKKPLVIPNLVNDQLFTINKNSKRAGKFKFLTVGAMSPQKGIDTLLKAIASWKPYISDIEFIIAGDGGHRKLYQSLACSLGISSSIRWEGEVDRHTVSHLFQEADAFVLPSRHETFGIVYCEAMASGIPVIATKCGGPELFVDPSNGLLIDVDDTGGLRSALEYMFKNAHKYDPEVIRASVVSRYSREIVANQVKGIYEKLV
jgi:glycosyltransferase involved in cell wall biosynthesis